MKQLSVIGLSNAGKTCYLYAMAKTMIKGYDGINAIALDDDLRDQLAMGWRQIRRENRWPSGTDKVTLCDFDCSLNLRPIMDFTWNDFKGGTLTSMNEIDKNFKSEFNQYLQNSDGLILFVPADVLQDILHGTDDAYDLEEDLEVLTGLFIANKTKLSKIPITIAITKSDILDDAEKPYAYEIVKNIFEPLFVKGNNMKVLVVPVSIGEKLGRGNQGGEISGVVYQNPAHGNIHIPILFNLYHFLKDCIAVEKSNLGYYDAQVENRMAALRKAEAHNGLQRFWYGENRDDIREELSNARNSSKKKLDAIRSLEKDLEKVVTLFTADCKYYIDGTLVSI